MPIGQFNGLVTSLLNYYKNRKQDQEYFPQGRYPSEDHPDYSSFNERFTRTPGVVVPSSNLPAGVDAQYIPGGGFPGEQLGQILIKPNSVSNTISHEAAHSLYNQAALYRDAPKLEPMMNPSVRDFITSSPHYQRAMAQDPSTVTDEGLGYAMNFPVSVDEKYVNAVANRVEDPILKQRLLQLFQHAKAMSKPGQYTDAFMQIKSK